MSDEMVGTVKLGTDGWPIKYCKDDFVSDDDRMIVYPSSAEAVTEAIRTTVGTVLAQIATWFTPFGLTRRRIETQGELDALPEAVVIMDDNGGVARKYGGEWRWVGMEVSFAPSLPVTVLWSPEAAS